MQIRHSLATLAFAASLLLPGPACPQPAQNDLLMDATVFKLGLVGLAPHISDEEAALASLLKQQDARAQLTVLLQNAKSNETRLYALCGMRHLSLSLFQAQMKQVAWDGETFNLMRADVVAKVPVKDQLRRMSRDGCTVNQL